MYDHNDVKAFQSYETLEFHSAQLRQHNNYLARFREMVGTNLMICRIPFCQHHYNWF